MGTHKENSDVDIVIKGKNLTYNDLVKIENDIDNLLLPYKIDISLFEHIKNPDLIDHINRVGIEIYKKVKKS